MNFKIGMKVVCVEWNGIIGHFSYVAEGEIHTISKITKEDYLIFVGREKLEGFQMEDGTILLGYEPKYYRPLDETFAEDILANITEQIEEEELVLI